MNNGAQANADKAEDHVAIPKKYITIAQTAGCLWLTAWAFFIYVATSDSNTAWISRLAQIGDAFGPLSSFLTVAALFTTAISTFVQIREFRSQLTEMRQSSEEMKKQTDTYELQLDEAKRQTKLLREQNIAESIRHSSELLPSLTVGRYSSHSNEDGYKLRMAGSHPIYNVRCFFEENGSPIQMRNGFKHDRAIFAQGNEETGSTDKVPTSVTITYTLVSGIVLSEVLKFQGFHGASNREWQVSELAKFVRNTSHLAA